MDDDCLPGQRVEYSQHCTEGSEWRGQTGKEGEVDQADL